MNKEDSNQAQQTDTEGVKSIDPAIFFSYAGIDFDLWNAVVGERVNHSGYGLGTIKEIMNKGFRN